MNINKQRLLDNFLKLVQIDALTRQEAKIAEELILQLKELGLEAFTDDAGTKIGGDSGNVIGLLRGTVNKPALMLSAHMDRVTPGLGIKPIIRDGVIYSDGTTILAADDVAGIAGIIEALQVIKENNIAHGPIEIAFTVAEEGGLHGAKNLDYSRFTAKIGFAFDSGGPVGSIVVQGPAQDKIEAVIHGKAAHAGVNPEAGINAIVAAGKGLARMNVGRIDPETTANVGIIKGGAATNIVTDRVDISAEARSLKNEKLDQQSRHMKECFEQGAAELGAKAEVKVTRMYSAFHLTENDPVVKLAQQACQKIGLTPTLVPSGGGSDANVFNANGIPTANLGMGYMKVHTNDEYMPIKDLEKVAELTLALIESIQ